MRRMMNAVTSALFSDINRQLNPILHSASFEIVHQEPSSFGGAYGVVTAIKSRTSTA